MTTHEAVFTFLKANRGLPFRTMSVFNFLLEAALAGGILILLLLLVRALWRKQLGSKAIWIAWLLVAVRLLLPVALPNPLMNELRPTYSLDAAARPVADQFRIRFEDAMGDLAFRMSISDNPIGHVELAPGYPVHEAALDVAAYTSYGWLGKWYFFAWLAGAGMTAACLGVRWLRRGKKFSFRADWPALLRGTCCALQWFNPFVWVAAHVSRKDEALAEDAPLANAGRIFLAVFGAVTLCSFFTAETVTPVPPVNHTYDLIESRGEEVLAALSVNDLPQRRPVATAEEAIALAADYIASPLLSFKPEPLSPYPDWCVFQSDKGWHVSLTDPQEEGYYLLLDKDGSLLSYKSSWLLEEETVPVQSPAGNVEELLTTYANAYVQRFLGAKDAQSVTFHHSAMMEGIEFLHGAGTADGQPFTIVVNTLHGTVAGFTLGEGYGSMQTQFEAAAFMRNYLCGNLGVNIHRGRMSLSRVMWDEERQRLLGVISEQATWISQEAAAKLAQTHGRRERYNLQLVVDPNGQGVEAVEYLLPDDSAAAYTVLDERLAADSITLFDMVKGRYLVQAGAMPAGTKYQVLDNRSTDGLILTGGAFHKEGLTLVRFTHPVHQVETTLWVGTPELAAKIDAPAPTWHTVTCAVQGKTLTFTGTDWFDTDPGYYLQPPENAITAAQAVAIALEAICADQNLSPEDFTVLPMEWGYRYDTDSQFGPSFWRVDVPDPRSGNLGYEIYINAHTGEILDYGAFGNG